MSKHYTVTLRMPSHTPMHPNYWLLTFKHAAKKCNKHRPMKHYKTTTRTKNGERQVNMRV